MSTYTQKEIDKNIRKLTSDVEDLKHERSGLTKEISEKNKQITYWKELDSSQYKIELWLTKKGDTLLIKVTIVVCVVLFILTVLFLQKTSLGKQIRAVSSNLDLSNIFGATIVEDVVDTATGEIYFEHGTEITNEI